MNERPEEYLFDDDLSPAQAEALRAAVQADPELGRSLARWRQLCAGVRESVEACLPDRSLLVLYALARVRPAALSSEEATRLAAARPSLEEAFRRHPALEVVVRQIQASQDAFEAAWDAHCTAPAVHEADRAPAVRRRSAMRWVARGAIFAAVAAFAVVALLLVQRDRHLVTIETAEGEVRVVQLGDGSVVRLLGSSVFSFVDPEASTAFARHARLVGRAFFEIMPAQQGFVIETPTARATVLGTRFGVQADERVTEVVLARGSLTLAPTAAPANVVVLAPGEMSRIAAGALPSTPVHVDLAEVLDWTGLFVFEATPLRDIAERLRAHFGRAVAVDPMLADEEVTGTFEQDQPLPDILRVIATTLGAEVRPQDEDGYLLAPVAAL